MKAFEFPLDKVLSYKSQIESNLKSEHAQILSSIAEREREKERLQQLFQQTVLQFEEEKRHGCGVESFQMYERYFTHIQKSIEEEQEKIAKLRVKEEKKRQEVIRARVETASIEKLKERRLFEYQKAVEREQELLVEEFVSNQTSFARGI